MISFLKTWRILKEQNFFSNVHFNKYWHVICFSENLCDSGYDDLNNARIEYIISENESIFESSSYDDFRTNAPFQNANSNITSIADDAFNKSHDFTQSYVISGSYRQNLDKLSFLETYDYHSRKYQSLFESSDQTIYKDLPSFLTKNLYHVEPNVHLNVLPNEMKWRRSGETVEWIQNILFGDMRQLLYNNTDQHKTTSRYFDIEFSLR